MKLYYSPGACSMSPHIVLHELGLPVDAVRVDLRSKKMADGGDYLAVNPKGYVPFLRLDDGRTLGEGPAIVQYLADLKPDAHLAPPNGSFERYQLQEWLNFIATELHKQFSPLFNPASTDELKAAQTKRLGERFDLIARTLATQDYLMPGGFTVADAYLFTVLSWCGHVGIDLAAWPALQAYVARVSARPAVAATLAAERGKAQG